MLTHCPAFEPLERDLTAAIPRSNTKMVLAAGVIGYILGLFGLTVTFTVGFVAFIAGWLVLLTVHGSEWRRSKRKVSRIFGSNAGKE